MFIIHSLTDELHIGGQDSGDAIGGSKLQKPTVVLTVFLSGSIIAPLQSIVENYFFFTLFF